MFGETPTIFSYFDQPVRKIGVLAAVLGIKHDTLAFHASIKGSGLNSTVDAPDQFIQWTEGILADWDFDNICTAHNGNCIGCANQRLRTLLDESQGTFDKIRERNAQNTTLDDDMQHFGAWNENAAKDGNFECG